MGAKHDKVVTHPEGLPPMNSYNPLPYAHERSRGKLKTLYVHYHNAYGNKIYQGGVIS